MAKRKPEKSKSINLRDVKKYSLEKQTEKRKKKLNKRRVELSNQKVREANRERGWAKNMLAKIKQSDFRNGKDQPMWHQ